MAVCQSIRSACLLHIEFILFYISYEIEQACELLLDILWGVP